MTAAQSDNSGAFLHSTVGVHRAIEPNSYAEILAAVRMVMRFGDATVMDALFEPNTVAEFWPNGKRKLKGTPMGRPKGKA